YAITGPERVRAVNNCRAASGNQRVYNCEFQVPAVGPAGKWKIKSVYFSVGNKKIKLVDRATDFRVLPNPGIVLPTKAELIINDSQTELLRREAANLEDRIQSLKTAISSYGAANRKGEVTPVLFENLKSALAALTDTEAEFVQMATAKDQTVNAQV